MKWLLACYALLCSAQLLAQPRLVIVIDDIGYHQTDYRLLELNYPLTYAVIPHTRHSNAMAQAAMQKGRDVILHMPMESARRADLSKNALKVTMTQQQIEQMLDAAFADVPQAIGMNNHMGSYFTEQNQVMDWTLAYLGRRKLFFLDSKTTAKSTAARYASLHQVPLLTRQVFLDNDRSYAALDKQFKQALQLAKQHQQAIAIGHPYPETYQYLQKNLATIAKAGVQLVPLSALLPADYPLVRADQSLPLHAIVQTKPSPAEHNSELAKVSKPAEQELMTPAMAEQLILQQEQALNRDYVIPEWLNPLTLPAEQSPRVPLYKHYQPPQQQPKPVTPPFFQLGRSHSR
ncbi:divergent polysaccharide deacetylase family protein [Rheinheimera sp.]|uniref:divergent polysaccharide deacetylase family protein n=1 Tax=Rheinheimera sp. TaxID=1869214 RepID=UPI003AF99FBB